MYLISALGYDAEYARRKGAAEQREAAPTFLGAAGRRCVSKEFVPGGRRRKKTVTRFFSVAGLRKEKGFF